MSNMLVSTTNRDGKKSFAFEKRKPYSRPRQGWYMHRACCSECNARSADFEFREKSSYDEKNGVYTIGLLCGAEISVIEIEIAFDFTFGDVMEALIGFGITFSACHGKAFYTEQSADFSYKHLSFSCGCHVKVLCFHKENMTLDNILIANEPYTRFQVRDVRVRSLRMQLTALHALSCRKMRRKLYPKRVKFTTPVEIRYIVEKKEAARRRKAYSDFKKLFALNWKLKKAKMLENPVPRLHGKPKFSLNKANAIWEVNNPTCVDNPPSRVSFWEEFGVFNT